MPLLRPFQLFIMSNAASSIIPATYTPNAIYSISGIPFDLPSTVRASHPIIQHRHFTFPAYIILVSCVYRLDCHQKPGGIPVYCKRAFIALSIVWATVAFVFFTAFQGFYYPFPLLPVRHSTTPSFRKTGSKYSRAELSNCTYRIPPMKTLPA